jgi:hypothetical protein
MPLTFDQLTSFDNRRLEPFMAGGTIPSATDIVGFEFRGWNIQGLTDLLGTRKFIKGFYPDGTPPNAWGYNMPVEQNGRGKPWMPKLKNGQSIRYYFYKVLPGSALKDAIYPRSLVVDYRQWPGYSDLNPVKYTVDYLVFPDPANRDLLVGKSYAQLGKIRPFLGFFILARLRPSEFSGPAPGTRSEGARK